MRKVKHDWHHLDPHNEHEGPFVTYYCRNCGSFATPGYSPQYGKSVYGDMFATKCVPHEDLEVVK